MNRLSQGHLNLLAHCPRKFQHVFLDRLQSPTSPEQQESLDWGQRFHQLVQQKELGLPLDGILAAEPQLARALAALAGATPAIALEVAAEDETCWRAAEHIRTLSLGSTGGKEEILLTVVYDLLAIAADGAQIFDWKTYRQPQEIAQLEADWQTRLYLYVLAETTEFAPEQLSMSYWFVRPPAPPQSATIAYDRVRHAATQQALRSLLADLATWLAAYRDRNEPFPQIPQESSLCQSCQFASRCQRVAPAPDWTAAIATTPEIEI